MPSLIGAATGLRYAYVDLALDHVGTPIELLARALRTAELPVRTWLLFFDATLKREWVGIYNKTPPPPGFDAD